MNFHRPMEAVIPTLDADVLAVLSRADTELSGREIHRIAAHGSHQGIRNAADRLTRQGVVRCRLVGSAHLYRLNREHVAARWIEGLATLPEQVIDRLRDAIGAWSEPPILAVLFGSVATGGATSESDLDLLIVRAPGSDPDAPVWRDQIADLQERATAWTGNDARIVEFGEEELMQNRGEPLLADVLADGIELYGSRRVLRRLAKGTGAR